MKKVKSLDKLFSMIKQIEGSVSSSFLKVKKEFEEHLDSINENTNEIQSNYESLLRLESKIDKIENSLAEVNRFIKQFKSNNIYFLDEDCSDSFTITPLSNDEKKIFKSIYELDAEDVKITYSLLADELSMSKAMIREFISILVEKGVPVIKHYVNQEVYVGLEPKFRELQTKKNIVNL